MIHVKKTLFAFMLFSWGASAVNCSVKGYDTGVHPAFIANKTIATAPACKGLCTSYVAPKCDSFAFGGGECLLYNVTVAGNVNPSNSSTFTFYDSSCTVS
ncbi:hypothetical protein LSUE1_G006223 [Lachnellula suecica]|uniref:Apple domain-containing protein n=1 Tax=Lachnellula suecica TaxID=602035 RepID=A0A8T9BZ61_9HELO|nr:hypothetical protein LSUE1_G006223 [Lachnellula suecica]